MSATKPTIVAFPGAFHPASCLDAMARALEDLGFSVETYTLPSVGKPSGSIEDDIAYFRSVLTRHLDAGREVILVVHSYAGVPGGASIAGLDQRGRGARGEKGGVLGIIYQTAFVRPTPGVPLLWWMKPNEDTGLIDALSPEEIFYNDCGPEMTAAVAPTLRGQAPRAIPHYLDPSSPSGQWAAAWREEGYDGRRAYIRCTRDNAIPVEHQDAMVRESGVPWLVRTLDASHSPFMSMPTALAHTLDEIATEFIAAA
ncbi:Alpha/beta hydrolase fold-1 [Xylariaceae sp. FL0804]|nr:Alpha/beta hydrolase fold-1 [Xylariaceae sp. FL0804]